MRNSADRSSARWPGRRRDLEVGVDIGQRDLADRDQAPLAAFAEDA